MTTYSDRMNMDQAPLLVIVGETASGKTSLAIDLAAKLNGEIICADSWTVRREVNIGTDKPDITAMKGIKHHLLDVVGPDEDFTAAVFKRLAIDAIEDIYSRAKLPIMVGGSGLYIDSVLFNYGFLDAGDRTKRVRLNNMTLDELIVSIKKQGLSLEGVDLRNKRRLIRVLESEGRNSTKEPLRKNTLVIGVMRARYELENSVKKRIDEMINSGLEQEVEQLVLKYGWECEALKGVGYKEWQGYFNGYYDIEETKQKIYRSTMNLAKKQRTWFKRNKSIHWCQQPVKMEEVVDLLTTNLTSFNFN